MIAAGFKPNKYIKSPVKPDLYMKHGGAVKGPGTSTSDSVPIMGSAGEYMLPAKTVKAMGGPKALDKLVKATNAPSNKPVVKNGVQALADGGAVLTDAERAALLASQPANVRNIPSTGYPTAPAADGSQDDPLNNEVGRNLTALQGGLPIASAAAAGMGMASRAGQAIGASSKALGFTAAVAPYAVPAAGLGALAVASSADSVTPAPVKTLAAVPTAPAVPANKIAPPGAPGAAGELPATDTPDANPNQITAQRQANGVMSFSGAPNIGKNGGDISYSGTSGFKPSGAGVTSIPAAGVIGSSQASDSALSAARAAAAERGDFKAISDSYGGNFAGGQYGAPMGMQTATQRLLDQTGGRPLNVNGMRALQDAQNSDIQAANQRTTNSLTSQKLGIDQQELGMKKDEFAVKARAAAQLDAAQNAYLTAKTPEAKNVAEQNLRALQNKFEKDAPDMFSTTPIPFKTDPLTGQMTGGGAIVTDKRTGNVRIISADEAKGQPSAPARITNKAEFDKLPVGTTYISTDGTLHKK